MFEDYITENAVESNRYWEDLCAHGDECYVGSFKSFNRDMGKEAIWDKYDIYVYKVQGIYDRQEVCVRYGKKDSEYMSMGALVGVIAKAGEGELHRKIVGLLERRGTIEFKKGKV
jgi:hypothetical protein